MTRTRTRYADLPLADIARRYVGDAVTPGEPMTALVKEFGGTVEGLYRRLVRDGYLPRAPKEGSGGRIGRDEFIRAWNAAGSVAEVARKAKVRPKTAVLRAVTYRKQGIEMKKFPTGLQDTEARRAAGRRGALKRKKVPPGQHLLPCGNQKCPGGGLFISANPRTLYCSDDCRRAAQNARNYARRKARKAQ